MYHVVYRNDHKCVQNSMTSDLHPATGTTQTDEHPPNYESNGHQSSSEEDSFLSTFATFDQSIELSSEGWSLEHIMPNYGMKPEPPLPNNSDSPFMDALNNIGEDVDANLLQSLSFNGGDRDWRNKKMEFQSAAYDREGAIEEEIIHGRDMAEELQNMLLRPNGDLWQGPAVMLIEGVLRSFTKSLSLLKSIEASNHVLNFKSSCSMDQKVDKNSKKKRDASDEWTINSAAPFHDEHQWRKYGQKVIRGSKFPRSYYRCANQQTCPATKQVQQLDLRDPPIYRVVYRNNHNCLHKSTSTTSKKSNKHPPKSESEENSFLSTFTTDDQSLQSNSGGFWSLDHVISNYRLKLDSPLPSCSSSFHCVDDLNGVGGDGVGFSNG
ncbi:WRKY transcription factor 55 [Acorus calamus]|uniref:WRKY transcription factor 55 n=1 Tax=Acorus calamus TaxID=4465 RepID=A0AAV9C4H6_ACOCL|nr:WRKY transcription factor 55 [Acorus calamus]